MLQFVIAVTCQEYVQTIKQKSLDSSLISQNQVMPVLNAQ